MTTRFLVHATAIALLALTTQGCTLWKVLTFSHHPNSLKTEGAKLHFQVFHRQDNNCTEGPVIRTDFVPAVLMAAGVGVLVNVLESELTSYLTAKQKEFTATYSANVTLPYFYPKGAPSPFNCLRVTRTFEVEENGTKAEKDAMVWAGIFQPNDSGTALRVKTQRLRLLAAAARTGKNEGSVDLSLEIKIDAVAMNDKREIVSTTIADKVLKFPKFTIGSDMTFLDQEDWSAQKAGTSSWFPALPRSTAEETKCDGLGNSCHGVTPVTIAVSWTEVGSGGDSFGALGKEIDDNKKTLNDAISKTITDALTPPSGGSSKSK